MIDFRIQGHRPLREVVYEELKKSILTGRIPPGTRMMEVNMAEEMGVSRTPVREAIRKLEKEGLVEIEPRRGAYVSDISVKEMVDTLVVREVLESLATSLAAENRSQEDVSKLEKMTSEYSDAIVEGDMEKIIHVDERFHSAIVDMSGNKTLIQLFEPVQEFALRFRYLYYDNFARYENMPTEHMNIVEAIRSGDVETAKKVSDRHVKKLKDFVMNEGEQAFQKTEYKRED